MGVYSLDMWQVRELLAEGLTPQQVAAKYFEAIEKNDPDTWIATLSMNQRIYPSKEYPGPYDVCGWNLGREKWRKYMVTYDFIEESMNDIAGTYVEPDDPAAEDAVLKYRPLFGPVPGFIEGEALHSREVKGPDLKIRGAEEVVLSLVREAGEWRIMEVIA